MQATNTFIYPYTYYVLSCLCFCINDMNNSFIDIFNGFDGEL